MATQHVISNPVSPQLFASLRCAADPACAFPPTKSGICRYHEQFFAFTESMTDSALDAGDYLYTDDNPSPHLSVVYGTGETRLKEVLPLPVALRDHSERDASVRLLRAHLKKNPRLTVEGATEFLREKGIHLRKTAVTARLREIGHKYSERFKESRALPIVKELLSANPHMAQSEARRILKAEHGIEVGHNAISRYFGACGCGNYGKGKGKGRGGPGPTSERTALVQAAMRENPALSASELFRHVKTHFPSVSRTTIDRDLKVLGLRCSPAAPVHRRGGERKLPRLVPLLAEELKLNPKLTYRQTLDLMRDKHSIAACMNTVRKAFAKLNVSGEGRCSGTRPNRHRKPAPRTVAIRLRRAIVRREAKANPTLSEKKLRDLLLQEYGIEISACTMHKDLVVMGVHRPHAAPHGYAPAKTNYIPAAHRAPVAEARA